MQYAIGPAALLDPLDLTLRKHKAQERRRMREMKAAEAGGSLRSGVFICALLVLTAGVMVFAARNDLAEARDAHAKLQAEYDALLYAKSAHDAYRARKAGAEAFEELNRALSSPNDGALAFLEEMEKKLPAGTIFVDLQLGEREVVFTATVPDKKDAARLLAKLRTFESLGEIRLPSIDADNTDAIVGGAERVRLTVTASYKAIEEGAETADGATPDADAELEADIEDITEGGDEE
jgi:Tfp pilus assembly protein PilN